MATQTKRYNALERLDTPYAKATKVWDDRIGSARQQAHSWKMAAFASFGLSFVLSLGLIYQSAKSEVVPYVVELSDGKHVRLIGTPATESWTPTLAVKRSVVERFIRNTRERSSDQAVIKQQWLDAYKVVTPVAKAQLDQVALDDNPFNDVGEQTRKIEISSMVSVSDETLRVEWTEDIVLKSGYRDRSETYVGLVKTKFAKPTTQAELQRNALGVFVEHFSWSVEHTATQGERK